jgi:uncharacterized protein (TIGR03435 family)
MKKLMVWMIALTAAPLFAQNITGSWQGTLQSPQGALRIVINISTTEADTLKALLYSIDQGAQPMTASAVLRNGSTVKIAVAAIGGNYEGRISAEGNSIAGTWTQGQPLPLTLARATPETAWAIPEPPPPPKRMADDAAPSFEVATIKPSRPEERFSLLVNRSGMLNTTSTSVTDLIKFAYNLHPRQIAAGPAWMESEKYDITGKPDVPGIPSIKQLKTMVQQLLKDRFALAFHTEKKELPVYAITIAKTGLKLTKNESNPNGLPGFGGGPRTLNIRNSTIAEFASMLQANILEQPVVDQTGLAGARFDFILKWTPDATQRPLGAPEGSAPAPAANDPDAPPDIFAAFQQQLGLRLQSAKAPVDVLVVDHVEKPSAN